MASLRRLVRLDVRDIALAASFQSGWSYMAPMLDAPPWQADVVPESWGREQIVYLDSAMDAHLLAITTGQHTSLHYHTKTTAILCLWGYGIVELLGGSISITAGDLVFLDGGVFHRIASAADLRVLAVGTPPNRADIVRAEDRYGRVSKKHVPASEEASADQQPIYAEPGLVWSSCEAGRFRFSVQLGAELVRLPEDSRPLFAVAVSPGTVHTAAGGTEAELRAWVVPRGGRVYVQQHYLAVRISHATVMGES